MNDLLLATATSESSDQAGAEGSASSTPAGVATGPSARPRWKIDDLLNGMMGRSIRVAAEAFAPVGPNGPSPRLIRSSDLVLPDGTLTYGLPVFFEGILLEVTRQIGVVHVRLGWPVDLRASTEGCVSFRGRIAVILRGPALVRLAVPFDVELVPQAEQNYWKDLRMPQAQFDFNFADGGSRK